MSDFGETESFIDVVEIAARRTCRSSRSTSRCGGSLR
jgi:hypothetical protein